MELHTNYAVRPLWIIWRICGMDSITKYRYIYFVYTIFITMFGSILSSFPMIAYQIIEAPNLRTIIANTPVTLSIVTASMKQFTVWYMITRLRNANSILDLLDSRIKYDDEFEYLKKAVNIAKIIFWSYFCLFSATLLAFYTSGLYLERLPFDAWYPFDYHDKYYGLAFAYQVFSISVLGFLNLTTDAYSALYIFIVTAHIRALQFRIQRINDPQKSNLDKNYRDLVNCIEDHININKIIEDISAVISKTIFIQFLVAAVIICNTATSLFIFGSTLPQFIAATIYLSTTISEVFPVCYFANKLIEETDNLRNTIFHSNWIGQSLKFQKSIIIFMQRTQLSNVIMAGNIFPITLPTLLQILKFSFSLFAIISQVSN